MSEIKNSIKQTVVPEAKSQMTFRAVAQVLESNERDNQVKVSYRDKNGSYKIKDQVSVQIGNADSWFPKAGDPVVVTLEGDDVIVTSRMITDYRAQSDSFSCSQSNVNLNNGVCGNTIG